MIRKYLRNMDYWHIKQNIHRLYLPEKYFGSKLINMRDLQLKTIIKLYRERKYRESNDLYI